MNSGIVSLFEVFLKLFYIKKNPTKKVGLLNAFICISQTYSGNAAPVGKITKSNTMNSAVLVG